MAELLQPDITGNYLSGLRNAQAAQMQQQQAQRQQVVAQQQDTTFAQGQQDRAAADSARVLEVLGPMVRNAKPGDAAAFDQIKQTAIQLGVPAEKVNQYTVDQLPALQQAFAASAPGRAMTNEDRQTRLTDAQIKNYEAEAARNNALAANGGQPKAPQGYTWGPMGNLTPIPGGPADPQNKPMTDDQAKALGFANRLRDSGKILAGPDATNAETSYLTRGLAAIPLVGNAFAGENYQQADQATRDFINAQLRRESGAAIGQSEFDNAYRQYIPRPGDSKAVLQQKARARQQAYENMMLSTGGPRGQVLQQNNANAAGAPGQLGPAASPAGGGTPVALPPRGQEPQRGQLYNTSRGPAVYLGNGQFQAQ